VSEDVWSATDTTPAAVDDALRAMLHARHAANGTLAPARVLNMVVIVDGEWKDEIEDRLTRVGRYHASRTVLCAVAEDRRTLDARAVMSYADGDGPGVIREQVVLDIGPGHLRALETIVDPVIVSELPTLLWCPHGHLDAVRALLGTIDVILLDSDDEAGEAGAALARAAALLESVYVVDLAWVRTIPWRERLAASFDPPDRREVLARIASVAIRHQPRSAASAWLLAGWLRSRLQREMEVGIEGVEQQVPGLAGVTMCGERGFSLSLDRGRGGLIAHEQEADGTERSWQVLGASRGEGGILGEGVRQALLRDATYGPALAAARDMLAA
jgi:glucose-6-phosphate dehydrogenase assembly protein OpcA